MNKEEDVVSVSLDLSKLNLFLNEEELQPVSYTHLDEVVGKDSYRRSLIGGQSARLICGYVYANAGEMCIRDRGT